MHKVSEYKKQLRHLLQYYIVEFFAFIPVFPRTTSLFSQDPEVLIEIYKRPCYLMNASGKRKAFIKAIVHEYKPKITHLKEYSKNLNEEKIKLTACVYNTISISNLLVGWGPVPLGD
jgi:hypothetical protein